jgi:trimethylamine--corrinoid protein Co-methyltransferase
MPPSEEPKPSRNRRRKRQVRTAPTRAPNYRRLRHPYAPQTVFSDDQIEAIHETALKVLEELGIKILLPEARQVFADNGARVDDEMVFVGRDIVAAALKSAPASFVLRSANPERELVFEDGALIFSPGSGCPNVTDATRGRRPGDLNAFIETTKLQQSFDVIHVLGQSAEAQDIPVHLRHYSTMQAQMEWSDKPIHIYSRGQGQVEQSFEMIQLALNLSAEEFDTGVWASSVINTNSPRLIDRPMARGIMDFAKANQVTIITPFCLAGAMAPVTVAGALTLQHAEALAGITLAQLTRAGAPVSYGGFASNVDMKSGSPAFGTPEHIKMQLGGGQLARFVGLPWRSAAGTSSNSADAQGANETVNSLWGALMGNVTLVKHAAGWLEGGLSFGYEKFINDIESMQTIAELCANTDGSDAEIGFDALKDVAPAGHFFETQHTMDRYQTAFYEPLVASTLNHGSWVESGSPTSAERAVKVWEQALRDYQQPASGEPVAERLASYIEQGASNGGAPPME